MLIVTGATGFIGTSLCSRLIDEGHDVIAVHGKTESKVVLPWRKKLSKDVFSLSLWLNDFCAPDDVDGIIHLGACTDTQCGDWKYLLANNVHYSADMWKWCVTHNKKFIYASSAATYGDGSKGFSDDHKNIRSLHPLNLYGWSKHAFDSWALRQKIQPPSWAGLKLFNVYGRNEAHKRHMASMPYQAVWQAQVAKNVRLFKYGEQKRDFVHVDDVVDVICHMLFSAQPKGIYNVGSGQARSFNVMAATILGAMGLPKATEYIDMPTRIAEFYQDYTCADISKLRDIGWSHKPISLEEGIRRII